MTDQINELRYHIHSITGRSPQEVNGTLPNGREFYYRSKYGKWELHLVIAEGEDPTRGFRTEDELRAILNKYLP